jgi:hypothetical protein
MAEDVGTFTDTVSQRAANATGDNLGDKFDLAVIPKCSILETTSLNSTDQLLAAGNPDAPNSMYASSMTAGADMYRLADEQYVGRDSNDIITGIGLFFDNIIIFKNDRFFLAEPAFDIVNAPNELVSGNFPWRMKLSNNDVGCESNHSIERVENYLYWKDERGFFRIEGIDAFGNVKVEKISNKIAPVLDTIPAGKRPDIISAHLRTPTRRHYRVAYSTSATNAHMFVYDYDHPTPDPETGVPVGAWLPWIGPITETMTVIENNSTGLDEVWVGSDDGMVYKMDQGVDDTVLADGAIVVQPVSSYFQSKHYNHDMDHATKRWRMIVLEGLTTSAPITMDWTTNFGIGLGGALNVNLIARIDTASLWNEDGQPGDDRVPYTGDEGYDPDTDTWNGVGDPEYDHNEGGSTAFDTGQSFNEGNWGGGVPLIAGRKRLFRATGHHIQFRFSQSNISASWKIHGFWLYAMTIPSVRVRKV